jgi:hypothetical protein
VLPFALLPLQSWLPFALLLSCSQTMSICLRLRANCSDALRLPIAAEILLKRNLMIGSAAIYSTLVARDANMVR